MGKFIGIAVVILIALGALLIASPKVNGPTITATPTADISGWQTYSNAELGITFSYPNTWGDVETSLYNDDQTLDLLFSNLSPSGNTWVGAGAVHKDYVSEIGVDYAGGEDLRKKCPRPRVIENNRFCKLFEYFEYDGSYLYESFGPPSAPEGATRAFIEQTALVNLKGPHYHGFTMSHYFSDPALTSDTHDAYLQSILDRTAPPAILDKIDTFEQVMLTLEVR